MTLAFFTVFRGDPQHYLHATTLVREVRSVMPCRVVQLTDDTTPAVEGVDAVLRRPAGKMLERRLEHYASMTEPTLFVDTDVSIRKDVSAVFTGPAEVILTDRSWPHLPQDEHTLQTMPFNTGVAWSQTPSFWADVLAVWRSYSTAEQDWMSEQRAVYAVVKTGRYRVQILPGQTYNYPPASAEDPCTDAAICHYKGPRKLWLSQRSYRILGTPVAHEVAA